MKAAVLTQTKQIEIQDLPIPAVSPGDVLIRTAATGICGSDLHVFRGTHPFRKPPVVLGHEIAGVVERVGADVQDFKPGDRVTVEPQVACGECYYCNRGLPNLCCNKKVPGMGNWVGTFAEYFVAPESIVYRVPDNVSLEVAALSEPLAVAVRAVKRAGIRGGETIAITGSGTIGIMVLIAARLAGAARAMTTDVVPYNLEQGRRVGADLAVDARGEDVSAVGLAFTQGLGFDVVFVTSGSPDSIKEASRLARKQGRVVVISMYNQDIPVDAFRIVSGEQEVVGSIVYTPEDFSDAIGLLEQRRFDWASLITARIDMSHLQAEMTATGARQRGTIKTMLILDQP